jgi:hypothetical protein
MTIQRLHNDLPPKAFMEQVASTSPEACLTYIRLWERKNKNSIAEMTLEEISHIWHLNEFKANLRKLNNIGLISDIGKAPGKISVELVDWQDIEDFED